MTSAWRSSLWNIPGRAWTAAFKVGPLREWLSAGAGMAWTLAAGALVWLFRDDLQPGEAFWIIETALLIVAITIVAITATGFNLRAGKGGVEVHVGAEDDDVPKPLAEVVTRTTVSAPTEVPPAAEHPDDDGELPADQRVQR